MSTQQTSQGNPLADFGPNEWIVDDMYQRYLTDPASVDAAWHEFFADYKPAVATPTAPPVATPVAPAAPAPAAAAPVAPAAPAVAPTAAPAAPAVAKAVAPAPKAATAAAGVTTPIRGVAAKIVQNMDASLSVPTATSVRAVPAKLVADNRIVINNHLARGRGGKVSFTHLIGYAMIHALAVHPEMNNSFGTVDGKPVLITPEHVNLGIAIDLAKPDGSRTLVVPSIKADRGDGLPHVLERVRGHRPPRPQGRTDHGRLRRHHDLADQPRRHRHRALAAAPAGRPGHDHRRRCDGIPGAVRRHERDRSSPRWRSARSSR